VTWNDVQKRMTRRDLESHYDQNTGKSASGNPGQSKASERYTPANPGSTSSSTSGSRATNIANPNKQSQGAGNASSPQTQDQAPNVSAKELPESSHRILFAVQGSRWSLDLEQIHVSNVPNDPVFFRELKTLYKKHRSWIKRAMSPFRFRFCKFVKVRYSAQDHILDANHRSLRNLTRNASCPKAKTCRSTRVSSTITSTHPDQVQIQ